MLKWIWQKVKFGIVPLFIICIPIFLAYKLWEIVVAWGLHITKNDLFDVPISIAILITISFLFGYLLDRPALQKFLKENCLEVPIVGGLLLVLLLPKEELQLVEIRTTWGPTPQEGNWEYALVTTKPWNDGSVTWYRVHTLGWTGKLFSRIGQSNVRQIDRSPREVWITVFSMGLL